MYSHEMIPSLQSAPLSSTISLVNIVLKLKSKDTIRGHPNYSSNVYRSPNWHWNSYQNQHGAIITSDFPQIRNTLWPRKSDKILCSTIHRSPPLWPYLPKIYQALLKMSKIMSNYPFGKNFYIQELLEGVSSIINVGGLIYYDNRMNCVYYGTAFKLVLHLLTGRLL